MRKSSQYSTVESYPFSGLTIAPSQALGGVRLIPLTREHIREDLRLGSRLHREQWSKVTTTSSGSYYSIIPHSLVATWTNDGSPAAPFGSQLIREDQWSSFTGINVFHRMRKQEGTHQLRFLPLHLAMEGFLALEFGGPKLGWEEYCKAAARGLSRRAEFSFPGTAITGMEDALRLFEIHERQVGLIVLVNEVLASIFVVPHPEDYRLLHRTLILDFFGELIYLHSLYASGQIVLPEPIQPEKINSLDDLRSELTQLRSRWNQIGQLLASRLLQQQVSTDTSYTLGPFTLKRFMTSLNPAEENHIGEWICREDGTLEYMKTFRLSAAQCRRAYLLKQLGEHQWHLDRCAESLQSSKDELIHRIEQAGFGYLLRPDVLAAAQKQR